MVLKIAPQALKDIRTVDAWWRANRPAARHLLRAELRKAFRLLREHPHVGSHGLHVLARGIRRLYLRKTRYFIYYSVRGEDVEILRVWHSSRKVEPRF
ncbi:MAG TPA: type II toxin-antitoxin system RelE/ParE family toxin [Myxococcaceae bacterium]